MDADQETTNYKKYQTPNPLMRWVIKRFVNRICHHVERIGPERIVDIGCGEGLVAGALKENSLFSEYQGIDINAQSIETAKRLNPDLDFVIGDFLLMEPAAQSSDMVLCLEVLEHLDNPIAGLRRLMAWSNNVIILSVPWEPYFSIGNFCRGLYMSRLGNHPEHVQWFMKSSFKKLLGQVFSKYRVLTCFPWLIAVAYISDAKKF